MPNDNQNENQEPVTLYGEVYADGRGVPTNKGDIPIPPQTLSMLISKSFSPNTASDSTQQCVMPKPEKEKVAVEYLLSVTIENTSDKPFSNYPLNNRNLKICCYLDYEGKQNQKEDKLLALKCVPAVSSTNQVITTLTEAEFNNLKGVFLWAEPYGYAALRGLKNKGLVVGRLKLEKSDLRLYSNSGLPSTQSIVEIKKVEAVCEIEVIKSVVQFIVDEMNKNIMDPAVKKCKLLNERYSKTFQEEEKEIKEFRKLPWWKTLFLGGETSIHLKYVDQRTSYKSVAIAAWGHKVHKNEGIVGLVWDVCFWEGGEWDHKPIIRPVWGTDERLGNSKTVYYYDIWSNIHYGYVGRMAGFSLKELLIAANIAQFFDEFSKDELTDVENIKAGYNLAKNGKMVTVKEIVDLVEQNKEKWNLDARKRVRALQKKKEEEIWKRRTEQLRRTTFPPIGL